ncbi:MULTISPECIES: hypothetical protein [Sphingobium]|uniref:hypothetical protein n=1 Tax=Sphingobium TaxID=165695 RepID=UPI0007702F49|nr:MULTISPECIES: hypothetical protein [unclassified Sphingobium]AMK25235.1 TonB-dependent receptor [Sphingobium sp. TKS]AMK25633.1 TonB-dependent receptor [Sphingobium sp. TKS]MCB4862165.1 hypothetical protein [Sphingobium sp. PNB]MEC6700713.1 hypothetical protein [Sphingobium sp. SJ10-10]PNQ04485.1 hypothetical protein A8G00_02570 [Sphingobium sp. SA916]
MKFSDQLLLAGTLCVLFPMVLETSQAQLQPTDNAHARGEIIVTAERRATDLQKTAIAISAFTPDLLEQRNLTSVGESDPIQEPVLAVYVDDVYVPRQIGSMSVLIISRPSA